MRLQLKSPTLRISMSSQFVSSNSFTGLARRLTYFTHPSLRSFGAGEGPVTGDKGGGGSK